MVDSAAPSSTATPRPWWRRAPLLSLAAALVVLLLGMAWGFWGTRAPAGPPQGLPWQVKNLPGGGSEVFGLAPGSTTLGEVRQRFGDQLRVALVSSPGQAPALEGYVESFHAGFVDGKLVLAFAADPAWLQAAVPRSPRHERTADGRSLRYELSASDWEVARGTPLSALTFLPSARLDEATVSARFGAPAERLAGAQGEVQLLYPRSGLAITVPPPEGELARARAVLQYVAPRDFQQRLRAPLADPAAPASSAASAAG